MYSLLCVTVIDLVPTPDRRALEEEMAPVTLMEGDNDSVSPGSAEEVISSDHGKGMGHFCFHDIASILISLLWNLLTEANTAQQSSLKISEEAAFARVDSAGHSNDGVSFCETEFTTDI